MDLLAALRASRIIPVLRTKTADEALELVGACVRGGLRTVEITATTTGWTDAVRSARAEWPDLVIGAGTILTRENALLAANAGAHFLISPYPAPAVRSAADELGIPFLEGGFTPAEVAAAAAHGPAKMFPAHVGGPTYLRSLLAVMPGAAIVPTGGLTLEDVPDWLAAGAVAVGVGSSLTASDDIAGRVEKALSEVDTA